MPACGGTGTFDGQVYSDGEASYSLGEPGSGWGRLSVEDDNDLAWSHDGLAAVIQINASCDPDLDIPLEALTNHLLIGFTDREVREEELVPMISRQALRTHVRARLDGVPRELLLVVLKKDGCVYDFALVAPPGDRFRRARGAYDRLIGSFRTGGES